MSFMVTGVLHSGTPYGVVVGDGGVSGSKAVDALVAAATGETVQPAGGGAPVRVKVSDPASVLALLAARTRVLRVEGDAPRLHSPARLGAIT